MNQQAEGLALVPKDASGISHERGGLPQVGNHEGTPMATDALAVLLHGIALLSIPGIPFLPILFYCK